MVMLVADIGGTNSRFACVAGDGSLHHARQYKNADFPSFDDVLDAYLGSVSEKPVQAAFAVAGPVDAGEVFMTNLGWRLSEQHLRDRHGIVQVRLLNDFAALAWATLFVAPHDLQAVGAGVAVDQANRAVIGPGTGLGAAGLVCNAGDWVAVAGEGGHVTLAGHADTETRLIAAATAEYGHCSAERLLSGPGLLWMFNHLGGDAARPAEVTALARAGDERALEVISIFAGLLGSVAGDLALTFGARGGVYLAGGILPGILDLLMQSSLRARFESKGRMSGYLSNIPLWVITGSEPALHGLAGYLLRADSDRNV